MEEVIEIIIGLIIVGAGIFSSQNKKKKQPPPSRTRNSTPKKSSSNSGGSLTDWLNSLEKKINEATQPPPKRIVKKEPKRQEKVKEVLKKAKKPQPSQSRPVAVSNKTARRKGEKILSGKSLRQAMIMHEILGKPKALQKN